MFRNSHLASARRSLTLSYCKQEYLGAVSFLSFTSLGSFCCILNSLNSEAIEVRYPLDHFITSEGTLLNWVLNCFYQALMTIALGLFVPCYFSLTWIMMNQCCWALDVLIEEVKASQTNPFDVKQFVEKSFGVLKFQENVQELLKFSFLLDFTVLSFILCLSLYALVLDTFRRGLVSVVTQLMILSQLYISCWIGTRVDDRNIMLSAAIFNCKWYSMNIAQRREMLLILRWSQSLRGFSGVFHRVNMETFQTVRRGELFRQLPIF